MFALIITLFFKKLTKFKKFLKFKEKTAHLQFLEIVDLCEKKSYHINMNNTIKKFLLSLGIDEANLDKLTSVQVKAQDDINLVVKQYRKNKPLKREMLVSIADVLGYNYGYMFPYVEDLKLIDAMDHFFDEDGYGYQSRSVSMLGYSSSELMQKLQSSFDIEPINLIEADRGRYVIGDNGLHRFNVMRVHYLAELLKLDPNDKLGISNLKKKYTFPAAVSEIDYFKTYCSFIIQSCDFNTVIETAYDENYNVLDEVSIIKADDPNYKKNLTDNELLKCMHKALDRFLQNSTEDDVHRLAERIKLAYEQFDSFKEFYDTYLYMYNFKEAEWNY